MTMTDNNRDEVQEAIQEATQQNYEVLIGTRIFCKASNEYDARDKAKKQFREQYPDFSAANSEHVLTKDYEPLNLRVPASLTQVEANDLLQWAIANADREPFSWSELSEAILNEENEEYNTVRETLDNVGLEVEVFIAFAMDNNPSMRWKFQANVADLEAIAENASESYIGGYSDDATFALEYYEESGELNGVPYELQNAIDWQEVWNDALSHDIQSIEVGSSWESHYFRNF